MVLKDIQSDRQKFINSIPFKSKKERQTDRSTNKLSILIHSNSKKDSNSTSFKAQNPKMKEHGENQGKKDGEQRIVDRHGTTDAMLRDGVICDCESATHVLLRLIEQSFLYACFLYFKIFLFQFWLIEFCLCVCDILIGICVK